MRHIFKCRKCGKYTMREICCGNTTTLTKPLKYSGDKLSVYRRKAKMDEYAERGLL